MICPECGGYSSEWRRSVDLGRYGTLELIIFVCPEPDCDWTTVYNWKLVQQHKMSFENKEEAK